MPTQPRFRPSGGRELKIQRNFYWYVCETPAQPIRQFQMILATLEHLDAIPDVIYLEGIWTHPNHQQHGIAWEGVVELTRRRLRRRQVLCLAIKPDETVAMRIYKHAGFRYQTDYRVRYQQMFPVQLASEGCS